MSTCKFCGQKKELVKAHILPRAFFEAIKNNKGKNSRGDKLKGVTNSGGIFPYKTIIKGLYDTNLVCLDCERSFGPTDDYASQLLLKRQKDHLPHYLNGELLAWFIKDYDYKKLILFFISLLWRAGASTLKEFNKVQLGPYLQQAKIALDTQDPEDIKKFSVYLARFEEGIGRNIIMDPHLEIKKGLFTNLNVYRFYLGAGYVVGIKVDKRPFPSDFESLNLSPHKNLIILSRGKFEESKELPTVQDIYKVADKLAMDWRK